MSLLKVYSSQFSSSVTLYCLSGYPSILFPEPWMEVKELIKIIEPQLNTYDKLYLTPLPYVKLCIHCYAVQKVTFLTKVENNTNL